MSTKQNTSSTRRNILGGGYALLLVAMAAVGLMQLRATRNAHADMEDLQQQIDDRQARQRQLDAIKKSVAEIEMETTKLGRLLPQNQDLGSFLTGLTDEFSKAGMTDMSYHNLAPTPLGRSVKLPIEVRGRGTYPQFQDFLTRLENLDRLCSVGRMVIDADADMAGGIEIQLTLYIYNSKSKQP